MLTDLGTQAFNALRHNKSRSMLTMLGMAWGIATVVLLLAYGSGFERGLMVAFETFGGNFIAVFPEINKQSTVAYGTRSASYDIRGTYANYQQIRHVDVETGSFFGEQENFS